MKISYAGLQGRTRSDAALKLCKIERQQRDSGVPGRVPREHGTAPMAVTCLVSQKAAVAKYMRRHFFPFQPEGFPRRRRSHRPAKACAQYMRNALTDPLRRIPAPAAVIMESPAEGGVLQATDDL